MRSLAWVALCLTGCDALFGLDEVKLDPDASTPVDAPLRLGPWQPAASLTVLNSTGDEEDVSLTADGLTMYFASDGSGTFELYRTSRASVAENFAAPTVVTEAAPLGAIFGQISGNGLRFYFHDTEDIYVIERADELAAFGSKRKLDDISSSGFDANPAVAPGEMFASTTVILSYTDYAIDVFARDSIDAAWQPMPHSAALQSDVRDSATTLSGDGLTIIFHSDRASTDGTADLFVSTRTSTNEPFPAAVPIMELNTAGHETDPFLSADQRTLIFERDGELFVTSRLPF
jgi:Tol biopolymer transport system component